MSYRGILFTVSAPSGAGKTSLVNALLAEMQNVRLSISHTTRPIRPGEQDGKNYHFVDRQTFDRMTGESAFLESAEVFGNYYGTSQHWVEETLGQGVDVILEIDWQGAQQVRKLIQARNESEGGCVSIFILPPSRDTLRQRLIERAQDDAATIERRLSQAATEMSHFVEYDYLMVNDQFERAVEDLVAIVRSSRLATTHQREMHQGLIRSLLS